MVKVVDVHSIAGDTYHNRFAPDRKHNKGSNYKPLKKKCSRCGTTSGQLDIHHKDGNRNNNNRSNLTYMCRSCHRSKHDNASILSSAARIIDDPNTKASKEIAKAHANDDLMYVEFILCHANTNKNKDRFTSEDMAQSAHTAVNKPINWEHTNKNIGVIFDSKFVSIANLEDSDRDYYGKVDPLKDDFIVCQAAIWEYKNPEEARIMRSRNESGLLFFSMENKFGSAQCSECNEVYSSVYDYCDHLLSRRHPNSNAARTFVNSNYVGAGVVGGPGDPDAKTLALAHEEDKAHLYLFAGVFSPEDFVQYMIASEKMRKGITVHEDYKAQGELDSEFYADDVNKNFPLDDVDNIKATAKVLVNEEKATINYEPKEIIYMLERTMQAAKAYDIDLSDIIKEGKSKVKDITEHPEFQTELQAALAAEIEKMKSGEKLKELQESINQAQASINSLTEKLEEKDEALAEKDAEIKAIAEKHESEKTAEARMDKLAEIGIKFSEESEAVLYACAYSLSENHFNSFVDFITDIKETSIAEHDEEMKKKKEEEEKNKKKKGGIVQASEEEAEKVAAASISNGESDDDSFEARLETVMSILDEKVIKARL